MDAVTHRTGGVFGRRRNNCIGRRANVFKSQMRPPTQGYREEPGRWWPAGEAGLIIQYFKGLVAYDGSDTVLWI